MLKYNCLVPKKSLSKLEMKKPWNIILTSGTLGDFEPYNSLFSKEFKISLRNEHIISPNQLKIHILETSRSEDYIQLTYKEREKDEVWLQLGETLLEYLPIIPGGVIIAFSSKKMMKIAIEKWQNYGIWDKINELKPIFEETYDPRVFNKTLLDYQKQTLTEKGACLFCYSGGKVTEGLDLRDRLCRGLFLVGFPYPNPKDSLIEKKAILQGNKDVPKWMDDLSMQKVNQTIGRLIRHAKDYGAVFLCEKRYAERKYKNRLPRWIRNLKGEELNPVIDFGSSVTQLKEFFSQNQSNFQNSEDLLPKLEVAEDLNDKDDRLIPEPPTSQDEDPIVLKDKKSNVSPRKSNSECMKKSPIKEDDSGYKVNEKRGSDKKLREEEEESDMGSAQKKAHVKWEDHELEGQFKEITMKSDQS